MTITSSPTYPIPGELTTLSATTTSAANQFDWYLTDVPESSSLEIGQLSADTFTPDVQGDYSVTVVESVVVGSLRRLVQAQTATVYVAELLEFPVKTATDRGLTVQLRLVHDTVRVASTTDHINEESRQATLPSTFVSALAALEGLTSTGLAPSLSTRANALRTAFEAHRADTSASAGHPHHAASDSTNTTSQYAASSNETAISLVNNLRSKLIGHMVAPNATTRWHSTMDDNQSNFPVAEAKTVAEAWFLLASLIRAYNNHRTVTTLNGGTVHGAADSTNTLAASLPLEDLLTLLLDLFDTPSRSIGYNYGGDLVALIGAKQRSTSA